MKRKLILTLALLLSVGLMTGCGEENDSPVATLNPKPIIIVDSSESSEESSQTGS